MNILGIWDGHDSGAALLVDGTIAAAINEERLTRRKLEIAFPERSLRACLELAGLAAGDVDLVAASTTDPAKTLSRLVPALKESYYQVRRRKVDRPACAALRQRVKYRLAELPPNAISRWLSRRHLRARLDRLGFSAARLELHDHHLCHAAAAAATSGFPTCCVLTLDGVGDGLSATISRYRDGILERIAAISARRSLGIFFEQVTHLLNMRELEDEGKVMALADHAARIPDQHNPLLALVGARGLELVMPARPRLLRELRRLQWRFPNEQLAAMAQRALEQAAAQLAAAACRQTGERRLALAGGVVSNVKLNRRIRHLPGVDAVSVFPHMGDGGLALGAAMASVAPASRAAGFALGDLDLGTAAGEGEVQAALRAAALEPRRPPNLAEAVAALLAEARVVLWFEGRMEYGPRALGRRSVLGRADRQSLRDRLNLALKRRVWYQPFCPTMLESAARALLADYHGPPNRHMTMAYLVRDEARDRLQGTISTDGTCRPQILPDEDPHPLVPVLHALARTTGTAVMLNTSFNLHGEPQVSTPAEAVDVLLRSGADALAMPPYLVLHPGVRPRERA